MFCCHVHIELLRQPFTCSLMVVIVVPLVSNVGTLFRRVYLKQFTITLNILFRKKSLGTVTLIVFLKAKKVRYINLEPEEVPIKAAPTFSKGWNAENCCSDN